MFKVFSRNVLCLAMVCSIAGVSFMPAPSHGFVSTKMDYSNGGGLMQVAAIITMISGLMSGGLTWVAVGGIFLDEESGEIQFEKLDVDTAHGIGLTQDEYIAYNSNVDIFNLVVDELRLVSSPESFATDLNYMLETLDLDQEALSALNKLFMSVEAL